MQYVLFLGDCKTTSGKACHFPFRYNGVIYEKCTKTGSAVYWCATATDYSLDEYGTCSSNCPNGMSA